MTPRVSVVVCTRNRASHLEEVLRSLISQVVDSDLAWELLVVDNASEDGTPAVVERMAEKAPVELRYLHEAEVGLSAARNRGWRAAQGEIVAFIDDDTLAQPRWLQTLVNAYASPDVAGASGRLLPLHDSASAGAVHPSWEAPFTFDRGEAPVDVRILSGANMSFRRDVLAAVGGFDGRLGRTGDCLLAGDENDLCRAVRRHSTKLRLVYEPQAVAHHKLDIDALSEALLIKRSYCGGVSNVRIDRKESPPRQILQLGLRLLKLASWALRALLRRLAGRPSDLRETARLQEFVGYYRELRGGPQRACGDCPMYPQRLARLELRNSAERA